MDIAFGSRALDRRLIGHHQPWRREQGGRVFNFIVRVATGLPFWTPSGVRAFCLDACRPILERAQTAGLVSTSSCFIWPGVRNSDEEIPVHWNHNEGSKVDFFHDSLRMLGRSSRCDHAVDGSAPQITTASSVGQSVRQIGKRSSWHRAGRACFRVICTRRRAVRDAASLDGAVVQIDMRDFHFLRQ